MRDQLVRQQRIDRWAMGVYTLATCIAFVAVMTWNTLLAMLAASAFAISALCFSKLATLCGRLTLDILDRIRETDHA